MKRFEIILRDGRRIRIEAQTYRLDGEQYVFDTGKLEVEFVRASEVVSIREVPPLRKPNVIR